LVRRTHAAPREKGILEEGEEVVFFYSTGLLSILEEGNLVTSIRVIRYEERKFKCVKRGLSPYRALDSCPVAALADPSARGSC